MDKINKIKEKILERYFEAEEDEITEREDNIEKYQNHKENVIFLDEVNDSVVFQQLLKRLNQQSFQNAQ